MPVAFYNGTARDFSIRRCLFMMLRSVRFPGPSPTRPRQSQALLYAGVTRAFTKTVQVLIAGASCGASCACPPPQP
eukprot:1201211-Pyramimonas_sp.AAC.1